MNFGFGLTLPKQNIGHILLIEGIENWLEERGKNQTINDTNDTLIETQRPLSRSLLHTKESRATVFFFYLTLKVLYTVEAKRKSWGEGEPKKERNDVITKKKVGKKSRNIFFWGPKLRSLTLNIYLYYILYI